MRYWNPQGGLAAECRQFLIAISPAIPPLKPIRERRDRDITVPSLTLWKAEMRVIFATFMGFVALAVASVQAAPNRDKDNWVQLGAARSFELGDQACQFDWHQALRRDWQGNWWWGPCVPNR